MQHINYGNRSYIYKDILQGVHMVFSQSIKYLQSNKSTSNTNSLIQLLVNEYYEN